MNDERNDRTSPTDPATETTGEHRTALSREAADDPDRAADALFERVATKLRASPPRLPGATYRVQFHKGFTFAQATAIVPYLASLGITDLYASPFFRAPAESMHGYDVVDPTILNPGIGTMDDLDALVSALRSHGMGLVLDIVPNHMGIGSGENEWWRDVLENGPASPYARFFDIDWAPAGARLRDRVLLPTLGEPYGTMLGKGELSVVLDDGAFALKVYDRTFPLDPRTTPRILDAVQSALADSLGAAHEAVEEFASIVTGLRHLPPRTATDPASIAERQRERTILRRRLAAVCAKHAEVQQAIDARLASFNGNPSDPHSFDALDALLEAQAWRMAFWRVAAEEINYRRFFDVNELAAVRMENPAVFAHTHRLILALLASGRVTGLRVDHPDGLWDPCRYVTAVQRERFLQLCADEAGADASIASMRARLVARFDEVARTSPHDPVARPVYLVVEKILARGEALPAVWPVHGTSGYDFGTSVGELFVESANERAITAVYEETTGLGTPFDQLVYEKKKLVLDTLLASELNVLAHLLHELSSADRNSRDFTFGVLNDALREVIACFPIYRTYLTLETEVPDAHDRRAIDRALRLARRRNPVTDASVFDHLHGVLTRWDGKPRDAGPAERAWMMKFQQLTSPIMAKGLEDTAFYVYNRFVALNEVGGEPERFGTDVATFHRANGERQRAWPASMLATSTHDTKRSEDVRMRLSVISEMPALWARTVAACEAAGERFRTVDDGVAMPDANERVLFYQSVLGTLPPDGAVSDAYVERLVAYMRKATKEAKVNTSWINASPTYDQAVEAFVRASLHDGEFMAALGELHRAIVPFGYANALAQTVLRLTSPGVADTYQGTELWDDSLVDPDNRRPVDYTHRASLLASLPAFETTTPDALATLVASPHDGRWKLHAVRACLAVRQRFPSAFGASSRYTALGVKGGGASRVVAFERAADDANVIVLAGVRLAAMVGGGAVPTGTAWGDGAVTGVAKGAWRDALSGRTVQVDDAGVLALAQVFATATTAVLVRAR